MNEGLQKRVGRHRFDLYFIVEAQCDEAEEEVTAALTDAGLFEPGLLDRRKLLFCETDMGKASIARQIESQLHVDESTGVVNALQRFVPYVSLVTANAKSLAMPSGSNRRPPIWRTQLAKPH